MRADELRTSVRHTQNIRSVGEVIDITNTPDDPLLACLAGEVT